MYRELTIDDQDDLMKYWRAEQQSPRWYRESNSTDECTDESFMEFCKRHRMFEINGEALLYVQKQGKMAEIHFSVLRKRKADVAKDLTEIRNLLVTEGTEIIFGWVLSSNTRLKRLCESLGLLFNGLETAVEGSIKKNLVRQCYSFHRGQVYIEKDARSLLRYT